MILILSTADHMKFGTQNTDQSKIVFTALNIKSNLINIYICKKKVPKIMHKKNTEETWKHLKN